MSDPDGCHSSNNKAQELTRDNPEDPGSRSLSNTALEMNGRLIRV
jgi:hypothetical protein